MTDDRDSHASAEAAELALRLLTGAELRNALARESSDAMFAAEVARWRARLASLHNETEEREPPANLWRRIEVAILESSAANDNAAALRRQLRVWRSATGLMTAAAAALALFVVLEPRQAAPPQERQSRHVQPIATAPLVAMLGDKGAVTVVASWDPATRQLILAVPGEIPDDTRHTRELWVIPAGGAPRSLGPLSGAKQMHVRLEGALAELLQHGATIAISVEPRGGSPTGAPTGPVVASGSLKNA